MERRLSAQAFVRAVTGRTTGRARVSAYMVTQHRWDGGGPCAPAPVAPTEPRETARLLKFPNAR